jgi:hypothetical protein
VLATDYHPRQQQQSSTSTPVQQDHVTVRSLQPSLSPILNSGWLPLSPKLPILPTIETHPQTSSSANLLIMPPDPIDPSSSAPNSSSGFPGPLPTSATSGQNPVNTPATGLNNPAPSSTGGGAGDTGGTGAGAAAAAAGGGTTPNPPPSATSANQPSPSPSTPTLISGMAGGPGGSAVGTSGGVGSSSSTSAMSAQAAMAQAAHYRPLNVRDALTYLDQVKVSRTVAQ